MGLLCFPKQASATWGRLNYSAKEFHTSHIELMLGLPAHDGAAGLESMSLKRVTNICLIRSMRKVEDEFTELELAAYRVAGGQSEAFPDMDRFATAASGDMRLAAQQLETYYDGKNLTCNDVSLTSADWERLMEEAHGLCSLVYKVVGEFVLQDQGEILPDILQATVKEVQDSFNSLMLGRSTPHLVSQPTQALYQEIRSLDILVHDFLDAIAAQNPSGLSGLAGSVCRATDELGKKYLMGGLAADPNWPGQRVQVLFKQMERVNEVFSSMVRNEASAMWAAINQFEASHANLLSGGSGLTEILPERQDMKSSWDSINMAWPDYKEAVTTGQSTGQISMTMGNMQTHLRAAVPVFSAPDVFATPTSPWMLGSHCVRCLRWRA